MHRRTVLISSLLLGLTACGQSSQPAAPESGASPQRVVVLDYNVLDSLESLGLADSVVGTSAIDAYTYDRAASSMGSERCSIGACQ